MRTASMCRSVALCAAGLALASQAASQTALADVIRFTSDNDGNIVIQGVAETSVGAESDTGIESRWANEGKPFEKFTGAFMNFLDRARAAACAFPGLPSKVGFGFGIAQIK